MEIAQIVGLGLIAAVLAVVLRQQKPELALLLSIGAGVLLFFMILGKIGAVVNVLRDLSVRANVNFLHLGIILKIVQPEPGQLLREAGLDKVEDTVRDLDREIKRALPEADFRTVVLRLIKGELGYRPQDLLAAVLRYLFREVVANAVLLGKLVILSIICAVLHNVSAAFECPPPAALPARVSFTP